MPTCTQFVYRINYVHCKQSVHILLNSDHCFLWASKLQNVLDDTASRAVGDGLILTVASSDVLTRTCYCENVLNIGRYVLQSVCDARYHDQLRLHGYQQRDTVHRVSTALLQWRICKSEGRRRSLLWEIFWYLSALRKRRIVCSLCNRIWYIFLPIIHTWRSAYWFQF